MPRALPRAMGALLAIAVLAPGSFARGQGPASPGQGKLLPRKAALAQDFTVPSEERLRLEEMKVALALLADMDTFPYSLGASAHGDSLELFGFVPDDLLRQRAVDLARRHTILKVSNAIGIRSDLSQPASPRPAYLLQQEAAEMLRTKLREQAKQITVTVGANGVIGLTGRTSSVESKLLVSRLLHQLPGCMAIDNQLTVESILRGGQRMVQVTHDGSLLVPPSELFGPGQPVAPPPQGKVKLASYPEKEIVAPSGGQPPSLLPPPPSSSTNGLITKEDGDSRLPTAVLPKRPQASPEMIGSKGDTLAPAKLPVKWGRPVASWETQTKQLETAHERPTVKPQANRNDMKPSPQDALPRFTAETKQTLSIPAEAKLHRTNSRSQASFAETRPTAALEMNWKRPGGEEVSEQKNPIESPATTALSNPLADRTPAGPPLRSSRRWPPAYVTGPKPGEGRPGVIVFADEPPPSNPTSIPAATHRRIVPEELQRQVKSLCGRQASNVTAAIQQDGSVLVKVKVPNRSIEDELSRKILSIPDMTAPNVRLLMDVER